MRSRRKQKSGRKRQHDRKRPSCLTCSVEKSERRLDRGDEREKNEKKNLGKIMRMTRGKKTTVS